MPDPEGYRKLVLWIPDELHRALKDAAYDQRRSMADIVREVVETYLRTYAKR